MNLVKILGIEPTHTFISAHPETTFMGVILRSKATKNLIVTIPAEILRFAQNDMVEFPDGHLFFRNRLTRGYSYNYIKYFT